MFGLGLAHALSLGPSRPLVPPFVGPLDGLTANMAGVWSVFRLLLSAWLGALIRVRRSGDDAEKDFYPDPVTGLLDVAALVAWVVAGGGTMNGYLKFIYGQDGLVDLVQTSASEQMSIVAGGVIVTDDDGIPAAYNPDTKWMQVSAAVSWRHWFMYHDTGPSANDGDYLFDARPDLANGYLFDDALEGANWTEFRKDGAPTTLNGAGLGDSSPHLNTILGSSSTEAIAVFLRFYAVSAANRAGYLREIVTFDTELDNSTRDAVEAALMTV